MYGLLIVVFGNMRTKHNSTHEITSGIELN